MTQTALNETDRVLEVRSLVPRVRDGDRAATRRVLELVAPSILGAVRSILGPLHGDLDDVVQDALIAVMRALPSFRGESSLVYFARQIAIRRAIDALRKTIRERNDKAGLDAVTVWVAGPALLERRQRQWQELLAELPDAQAEVLALRAIEGYTIEEISEMTQVAHETVRSRLRLARKALRDRIEGDPRLADLMEDRHEVA